MRGILKKLLCGVLVFLYAASFVMLAYTSVNAKSVTEKAEILLKQITMGIRKMLNMDYLLTITIFLKLMKL